MKKRKKRCDYCKKLFDKSELKHTPNPYEQDINGDNTLYWLCKPYIELLADEI